MPCFCSNNCSCNIRTNVNNKFRLSSYNCLLNPDTLYNCSQRNIILARAYRNKLVYNAGYCPRLHKKC